MSQVLVASMAERYGVAVRVECGAGQLHAALDAALPALFDHLANLDPGEAGKPYFRYLGFNEAGQMIVEAGVETRHPMPSAPGVESVILPGGEAAISDVRGDDAAIARGHEELDRWMEASGRQPAAPREELQLAYYPPVRHVRLIQILSKGTA